MLATAPQEFLVFSPTASTAQRTCVDFGRGASVSIPKGISTVTLPVGCYLDLSFHRVYADNSIHISSHQFSYNWDWDTTIAKLGTDPARLAKFADTLRSTSGPLHLRDVLAYTEDLHRHQDALDQQAQIVNSTISSRITQFMSQLNTLPFALSSSALALFAIIAPVS